MDLVSIIVILTIMVIVIVFLLNGFACCDKMEHIANIGPYRALFGNDVYEDDDIYGSAYMSIYPADISILSRLGLLPWWNSTRHTRNSSYDLRGDVPVFVQPVGPWLNSEL